jgi:hypothetical protein
MARWRCPDAPALALIAFTGRIAKEGKRPRFRFTTHQRRITSYLAEIDAALMAAGKDQDWLHRKTRSPPFAGRTPIEYMVASGTNGMADVLSALSRAAMQAALTMPRRRSR